MSSSMGAELRAWGGRCGWSLGSVGGGGEELCMELDLKWWQKSEIGHFPWHLPN